MRSETVLLSVPGAAAKTPVTLAYIDAPPTNFNVAINGVPFWQPVSLSAYEVLLNGVPVGKVFQDTPRAWWADAPQALVSHKLMPAQTRLHACEASRTKIAVVLAELVVAQVPALAQAAGL